MTPAEAIALLRGEVAHIWVTERHEIADVIENLLRRIKYKDEVIEQRNRMLDKVQ